MSAMVDHLEEQRSRREVTPRHRAQGSGPPQGAGTLKFWFSFTLSSNF